MKKITLCLLGILAVMSIGKTLFAESVVIADAQVVATTEKDFVLHVRSSGPQAFDVEKNAPLEVRFYQATLGDFQLLGAASFGAVEFIQDKAAQVLLKIQFADPAYKAVVTQGDSPNAVDIRVLWAPDQEPPVLGAITASAITETGATVSWTTNEPSDTQLAYGVNQPESQFSVLNPSLATAHQVVLSGLSPGTPYFFKVRSRDAAGNLAVSEAKILTTGVAAFQESGGSVTFEAENFDANTPKGTKSWTANSPGGAGYSGNAYLAALPNTGSYIESSAAPASSPELVYRVNFTRTGTYYVWIRGRGASGNDDSIHAGLNGTAPASADRITSFQRSWTWSRNTMDGPAATLVVSRPGVQKVHLWMREDGMEVDKIMLTTSNVSQAPSGMGPAESRRTA